MLENKPYRRYIIEDNTKFTRYIFNSHSRYVNKLNELIKNNKSDLFNLHIDDYEDCGTTVLTKVPKYEKTEESKEEQCYIY